MTPKQERFCQEYLIDLNATQAAIRAGYSTKTATKIASENLTKPDVKSRLQELMASRAEATDIDAQWVLKRLAKIADFDIRKMFDDNGNLLPIKLIDEDSAYAIAAIDIGELTSGEDFLTQTKKFKAADRLKALELIGKHLAMFTDRVEQTGNAGNVVIYIPDNGRDRQNGSDE